MSERGQVRVNKSGASQHDQAGVIAQSLQIEVEMEQEQTSDLPVSDPKDDQDEEIDDVRIDPTARGGGGEVASEEQRYEEDPRR